MMIVENDSMFILQHKSSDVQECSFLIDFFSCESSPYLIGVTVHYVPKDNPLYLKLKNTSLDYEDFSEEVKEEICKLPFEDFYLDMSYIINWFLNNKDTPFAKMGIFPVA